MKKITLAYDSAVKEILYCTIFEANKSSSDIVKQALNRLVA